MRSYFLTSQVLSVKMLPMHHAMNHVGFMISPELNVVQDRVHGPALYCKGHGCPEPQWIQGSPFASREE